MKQKYKFSTLVAFGVALPMLAVFAQTDTSVLPAPSAVRQEIQTQKTQIQDARTALQTDVKQLKTGGPVSSTTRVEIKDLKASTTAEVIGLKNNIRGEELNNKVKNTSMMLTASGNRFYILIRRITSRVIKIGAAGGNITAIQTEITQANTDVATAKTDIANISAIDLSGSSSTVATNFAQVKVETKTVKDLFLTIKTELEKIVADIKVVEKTVTIKNDGQDSTTTRTVSQ
jgi:hypothetical protein